jgi:hypothetical protein
MLKIRHDFVSFSWVDLKKPSIMVKQYCIVAGGFLDEDQGLRLNAPSNL